MTITFRNLTSSPTVEAFVRHWAAKLETAYDRIERCTVVIERPHLHHHQGQRYAVRVTLAIPGSEVNVSRDHDLDGAHEDLSWRSAMHSEPRGGSSTIMYVASAAT